MRIEWSGDLARGSTIFPPTSATPLRSILLLTVAALVLAEAASAQQPEPHGIDVEGDAVALDTLGADSLIVAASAPALRRLRPQDTTGLATGRLWAATVTAAELREHAYLLAGDSLRGRETGEPGQRLAAAYLSAEMEALGLPRVGADGSYEQPIAFESFVWDTAALSVGADTFPWLRGFYALPGEVAPLEAEFPGAVFLGYGIDAERYSDYAAAREAGVDLRGRVAVVLGGEPRDRRGDALVTGTPDSSAYAGPAGDSLRLAAAERAGLAALLLVEPDLQARVLASMSSILERGLRIVGPGEQPRPDTSRTSLVRVNRAVFEALVGEEERAVVRARQRTTRRGRAQAPVALPTPVSIALQPERRRLRGANVLGYVPGSDPELADQLVVVSAHYDHLGERGGAIYNGADDNASGTSTVLEIVEGLAAARRAGQGPRRSVLALLVSGEEKGLLGSKYYAENPVFPLASTVADVNIDMIGRYDEAHADSAAYIYVIGAGRIAPDLDSVVRAVNHAYSGLDLDYTFDAPDDPNRFYYRSDHYSFASRGVPAVFFFSGVHADYHRPTDTPDKLDYDKMARVGRHAFLVTWVLANRDEAPARILLDE